MTTEPGAVVARRTVSTGERLLSAALNAFATTGFEGTSMRQIERMAGVERGLAGYHFGSKQELWNRAVDALFNRYTDELESLRIALRDVPQHEATSAMLMAYARFTASNPEFFRILIIEGHVKSERSERLAHHLRRALVVFSDLSGEIGAGIGSNRDSLVSGDRRGRHAVLAVSARKRNFRWVAARPRIRRSLRCIVGSHRPSGAVGPTAPRLRLHPLPGRSPEPRRERIEGLLTLRLRGQSQ